MNLFQTDVFVLPLKLFLVVSWVEVNGNLNSPNFFVEENIGCNDTATTVNIFPVFCRGH